MTIATIDSSVHRLLLSVIVTGIVMDVMAIVSPLIVQCINVRSIMPLVLTVTSSTSVKGYGSMIAWPLVILIVLSLSDHLWLLSCLALVTITLVIPQSLMRLFRVWSHCRVASHRIIASREDAEF